MQLLLCVNDKKFAWRHNLRRGKVYKLLEVYKCVCGHALFRVEGATVLIPMPNIKLRCKKCGKILSPDVWGAFWYKRFIPINDPDLKVEETYKEIYNAEI